MSEIVHDPNENTGKESEEKNDFASSEMAVYRWLHSLQWKGQGEPDGHACLTGRCGETIEIFLNFNGERVKEAAYLTNGCISSRVCAALIAQMAHGKTPDELLDITAQSILSLLGDFPESEVKAIPAGIPSREKHFDFKGVPILCRRLNPMALLGIS